MMMTLRKYMEAIAGGCLAFGDVPADSTLSAYVVDAEVMRPGVCNPDEGEHRKAVAALSDLGDPEWLPVRQPILGYDGRDLLEKCGPRNKKTAAEILARRTDETNAQFRDGVYDGKIREARTEFLQNRDYAKLLLNVVQPAFNAANAKERGWLRTPFYFRTIGRKYETRHKYLLAEWLLREMDGGTSSRQERMRHYLSSSFDELLSEAEQELGRKFNCPVSGREDCLRTLYFPGMAEFDWKFIVQSRGYLSQKDLNDTNIAPHGGEAKDRGGTEEPNDMRKVVQVDGGRTPDARQ